MSFLKVSMAGRKKAGNSTAQQMQSIIRLWSNLCKTKWFEKDFLYICLQDTYWNSIWL